VKGREFANNAVDDLCRALNIKIAMTSAYHPQSNGLYRYAVSYIVTSLLVEALLLLISAAYEVIVYSRVIKLTKI